MEFKIGWNDVFFSEVANLLNYGGVSEDGSFIPARPFIEPFVEIELPKHSKNFSNRLAKCKTKKEMETEFLTVVLDIKELFVEYISTGEFKELSERRLRERAEQGLGDKPLLATGKMQDMVKVFQ